MNDQIMNEGFWSVQNKVWLQMAMWMEWIRPFLYCLLALALLSLLWTFVNMVLLCRKELSGKQAQKKIKVRTKAEPARKARNVARATLKKRSQYAIKTLFLLGYCCAFSQAVLAQDQSQDPYKMPSLNDVRHRGSFKHTGSVRIGKDDTASRRGGERPRIWTGIVAGRETSDDGVPQYVVSF